MPPTVAASRANARRSGLRSALYRQHTSPTWLKSCEYNPVTVCSRKPTEPGQERVRPELALCGETVLPMLYSRSDVLSGNDTDLPHAKREPSYVTCSSKYPRRRVEFNPSVKVSSRSRSPNRSFSNTPLVAKGLRTRSGTLLAAMNSSGSLRLVSPRSSFVSSVSRTPSSWRSLFGSKSGADILPPPPQFRSDRSSSFVGSMNGRSSHDTNFSFAQSRSAGFHSSSPSWEKRPPQSKPSAPIMFRPNAPFRATRQCASDVPVTWCRLPPTGPRVSKENAALRRGEEDAAPPATRRVIPEIRPAQRRPSQDRTPVHKLYPRAQTLSDLRLPKRVQLGCSLKPRKEALVKYRPSSDSGQRRPFSLIPTFSGHFGKCDASGADIGRRTKPTMGPSTQIWSMKSRLNLSDFGKSSSPREMSPGRSAHRRRSPRRYEPRDRGRLRSPQRGTGFDVKAFSVPEVSLGHSLSTDDKLGIVQEWLKRKPSNPIVRSKSDGGLYKHRTPLKFCNNFGGQAWDILKKNSPDSETGSNKVPTVEAVRSNSPKRIRRLQELRPDFCNVSSITRGRKLTESNSFETRTISPKRPLSNDTYGKSENLIYAKATSEPYLYRRACRGLSPPVSKASFNLSTASPSSSEPHIFYNKFPVASRNASPVRSSTVSKTNPEPRMNTPGRPLRRAASPNRNVNIFHKVEQKLAECKSSKSHSQALQAQTGGSSVPITSYDSRTWHSNIYSTAENRKVNKCRSIGRTTTPVKSKREVRATSSPNAKKTFVSGDNNKPSEKNKEQHKPNVATKSKVVKNQGSSKEKVKNVSSKRKKVNLNFRTIPSDIEIPVHRSNNRRFDKTDPVHSFTTPSTPTSIPPRPRLTTTTGPGSPEVRASTPKCPKRATTRTSSARNASDDHHPSKHTPTPHATRLGLLDEAHRKHKSGTANKAEGRELAKEITKHKRSQKTVGRKILKVQVPFPFELLQSRKESGVDSTDTLTRKSDTPKSKLQQDTITLKRSPLNDNIPVTITRKSKIIKSKKTTELTKVEDKQQIIEGLQPKIVTLSKRRGPHISVEPVSTADTTTVSGHDDVGEKARSNAVKPSHLFEKCSGNRTLSSTDEEYGTRNTDSLHMTTSKVTLPISDEDIGGETIDIGNSLCQFTMKRSGSEVKEAFDALPLHNQYALNDLSALIGIARLLNIDADSCLSMVGLNACGKKTK